MPLKSVKHQKAPSGQSVSTNFVANCWQILSFVCLLALIHNKWKWRINLDKKNFKPEFNLTHNLYTVTYVNLFQQHDKPLALLIKFMVLQLICSEKRKPSNKQEFTFGKSNYCSVAIFSLLIQDD